MWHEGQWVFWKTHEWTGYIEEVGVLRCKVAFPQNGGGVSIYVLTESICKIGTRLVGEDVLELMDIALMLKDETWLRELCGDYDEAWRNDKGITS